MIQFDDHIFQMGWNHQLVSCHVITVRLVRLQSPTGIIQMEYKIKN